MMVRIRLWIRTSFLTKGTVTALSMSRTMEKRLEALWDLTISFPLSMPNNGLVPWKWWSLSYFLFLSCLLYNFVEQKNRTASVWKAERRKEKVNGRGEQTLVLLFALIAKGRWRTFLTMLITYSFTGGDWDISLWYLPVKLLTFRLSPVLSCWAITVSLSSIISLHWGLRFH